MIPQPVIKLFQRGVTALAVWTICFTGMAQLSAGIESGYNRTYLQTNFANRDFSNYKPGNGFSVGLPVQYKLATWFAIETDPTFIQKSYTLERSSFYRGIYQTSTNSYVQLPLLAHFMFGGQKLQGFFNLGAYGAYWVTGHVKGTLANVLDPVDSVTATNTFYNFTNPYAYNEKYAFDTRRDNRIEAGWVAGAGISYALNSSYQLFAEGRYTQAITDMQKNYMINQTPRYNETYSVTIGCMRSFGKRAAQ